MYRLIFALLVGFILLGANEVVLYENPRDTASWAYEGNRPLQFAAAGTQEEWERQLAQLEPMPPNLPEVDWEQEFPILVYLGEHPTGGYAVQIDGVHAVGRVLVVQVSRRSPAPGAMVTMAFTYPKDMITLPKEHLEGVETIRFVNRDKELLGEIDIF
ncbi:MAG TPA: protease complex subunit PrcB family protein [Firmicutes bacterium]|jgi:hypothetical protein|nr:MAG: hypothetical protein AA931_06500 [Peptococcaceae bacterium 1109]HHT72309.1 protease complex subunit PrcB family protein [Bacillota bacterium]